MWIEARITASAAKAPLVELAMEALGALSVTLEDAADQALLEPGPGEAPLWNATRIVALFPAETDTRLLAASLTQALGHALEEPVSVEFRDVDDQVWERAWLEYFHPMCFGKRLWVCPRGQSLPQDAVNPIRLILDPGLAFGTGTHPTTALCLRWLDAATLGDKTAIDYGCGSGILAIAALLLGARQVIATDHDPQALQATRENAEANGVLERLRVMEPGELIREPVDILLANILAGTLVDLADVITPLIKPGGQLVMSGILVEQGEQVRRAYSASFEFDTHVQDQDWVLLSGRKF